MRYCNNKHQKKEKKRNYTTEQIVKILIVWINEINFNYDCMKKKKKKV